MAGVWQARCELKLQCGRPDWLWSFQMVNNVGVV